MYKSTCLLLTALAQGILCRLEWPVLARLLGVSNSPGPTCPSVLVHLEKFHVAELKCLRKWNAGKPTAWGSCMEQWNWKEGFWLNLSLVCLWGKRCGGDDAARAAWSAAGRERTVLFSESVEQHQPVTFTHSLAPGLIPGTAVTAGQQQLPGKL